jgi:hypothetical protein
VLGIVLLTLAVDFALIEAMGRNDLGPGVFAMLLGTSGLGNLDDYFASRRLK